MGKDENKVNKENSTFSYTYSAKQQEEIKNIRRKYVSKEEDKMEKFELLREVDPFVRMVRLKIDPNPLTNKLIFSNLSIITILLPHIHLHQTLLISFSTLSC